MSYRIRAAAPADAASLLAIYAPYVTDTCVSFELEVPTVEEFERRIQATLDRAAYLWQRIRIAALLLATLTTDHSARAPHTTGRPRFQSI